ncbi:molybdenum cofactor guanylyltransferase [Streptomyces omiyaensis]|nr:molybdenum cofactor guanylyltransferase [Streptomyces omiyaensis]
MRGAPQGHPRAAAAHTAGVTTAFDAVVLAGGAARRLGGVDKPGVRVGGRALLDRVLAACAGARATVVVGDPRPTVRPVRWTREERIGSGPVAALDAGATALRGPGDGPAGLPASRSGSGDVPASGSEPADAPASDGGSTGLRHSAGPPGPGVLLVLSADLPFLGEATVRRLLAALEAGAEAEAALLTDAEGRDQPLVAVYRAGPLRRELEALRHAHRGLDHLPLRFLTGGLRTVRVPAGPDEPSASFDCDTWEDIATARARIRDHGAVLDEWITAVKTELGLDLDVDTGALLDLARDAAHGVARPAAPLTTFLVGYAAARAAEDGTDPAAAVAEASRKAAALAQRWAAEQDEAG